MAGGAAVSLDICVYINIIYIYTSIYICAFYVQRRRENVYIHIMYVYIHTYWREI